MNLPIADSIILDLNLEGRNMSQSEIRDHQVQIVKVLLVEDNPVDADLVRELLAEGTPGRFESSHVERLSQALACLGTEDFDLVLLDLSLPDSQGLDTLLRTQEEAPEVPIIVLTGANDGALALRAVQAGAQDYLAKGQIDSQLLVRSMNYAIERHRLLAEAAERQAAERQAAEREAAERIQQLEGELRALEQLSGPPQTAVTAQLFDVAPLRDTVPATFNDLVRCYGDLMDLALDQQAYKVNHDVSESLRAVVEQLGFLRAGPRDVVEIHSSALKRKTREVTHIKAQVYIEEGRLMVLELMGYLVSFYRDYTSGVGRAPLQKPQGQKLGNKQRSERERS